MRQALLTALPSQGFARLCESEVGNFPVWAPWRCSPRWSVHLLPLSVVGPLSPTLRGDCKGRAHLSVPCHFPVSVEWVWGLWRRALIVSSNRGGRLRRLKAPPDSHWEPLCAFPLKYVNMSQPLRRMHRGELQAGCSDLRIFWQFEHWKQCERERRRGREEQESEREKEGERRRGPDSTEHCVSLP